MFITNGITICERHGKGSSFVPGTVPKVRSSTISTTSPDGISINWDRPMMISASLKDAITVKVNGTAVAVKNVVQNPTNPKQLGIVMNVPFKHGDVVTWAYNDQHATEFLKGAEVGGVKADNQTYSVVNNIPLYNGHRADSTTWSADTTAFTADEGI